MRISNPQNMNGEPLLTGVVTSGIISGDGTRENPLVVNISSVSVEIDSAITSDGVNAVQGQAIYSALEEKADATHEHAISEVSGLQTALDGKAASSHTHSAYASATHSHSIAQVSGLQTALNDKAAASTVTALSSDVDALESMVSGIESALDGKAASSHTHAQSDISGLGDALASKASSVHTHTMSDITDMGSYVATSEVDAANGVAGLNASGKIATSAIPDLSGTYAKLSDGKIPTSLLPSYVSDVFEGYLIAGVFHKTNSSSGEVIEAKANAIYVDKTTDKTYRWSGSQYTEISKSLALGTTSETAYPGDSGVALSSAVASNSSDIYSLQTTVDGKADSATVTSLSTRVSTLEGQTVTLDTELSSASTNGVQNKAIDSAIKKRLPTYSSTANGLVLVSVSGGAAVSASNFTVNSTSTMGSSTTVIPNEAAVAGKLAGYAALTSGKVAASVIPDLSGTYAASSHEHAQSEITGLSDALAGKQDAITSSNKLDYSLISGTPTIPDGPTTSLTSDGTNSVQAKTIYAVVEDAKTYADTKMAKVSSATANDLAKLNASGEVVDAGVSVQTSGALDSSGTKVAVNSVVSAAIQSALSAMSWQAL